MFQQGLMYLLRWPLEASTDQLVIFTA